MIQSLDRLSLAKEIDKQAKKIGKVMDVLCEVNIGCEESKSGVHPDEVLNFLKEVSKFNNIHVCGLMSIPPILTSISTQKEYFQKIMDLYIDISAKKIDNISMSVLSFGMSSDYDLAVECGSTIVRIGTAAFGERNYY
jgi:pyridoxal phosphate enzyme (YggS family)